MTEQRMRLVQLIDGLMQEGRNLQGNFKGNFMDAAQVEDPEEMKRLAAETAAEAEGYAKSLQEIINKLREIA